jgi:hypothetical protein
MAKRGAVQPQGALRPRSAKKRKRGAKKKRREGAVPTLSVSVPLRLLYPIGRCTEVWGKTP